MRGVEPVVLEVYERVHFSVKKRYIGLDLRVVHRFGPQGEARSCFDPHVLPLIMPLGIRQNPALTISQSELMLYLK